MVFLKSREIDQFEYAASAVALPNGETELHMFTVGGGTPQETVDEIGNKLGAKEVAESRGHGIIVEARHYDHFLGADAGRNLVAQGRGPAGSYNFFQSAETGQGRLARNADNVRKMGQVGQTAVPARGLADTLGQIQRDLRPQQVQT